MQYTKHANAKSYKGFGTSGLGLPSIRSYSVSPEVLEYCKVLGLNPDEEKDLLYIAKEGIKAPLPEGWKPV